VTGYGSVGLPALLALVAPALAPVGSIVVGRPVTVVGRPVIVVGRSVIVVGRSVIVVGRSVIVVGRSVAAAALVPARTRRMVRRPARAGIAVPGGRRLTLPRRPDQPPRPHRRVRTSRRALSRPVPGIRPGRDRRAGPDRPRRGRRQERDVHRVRTPARDLPRTCCDRRQGRHGGQPHEHRHDQHVTSSGSREPGVGPVHAVPTLAHHLDRRHGVVVALVRHYRLPLSRGHRRARGGAMINTDSPRLSG